MRVLRRVAFWTAMAVAAALLVSLFVSTQRPPSAPSISYSNHLDAELAAGAPPASAPKPRAPRAPAPRSAPAPMELKLIPMAAESGIKRVELLEKMPPEEGLIPASFTAPSSPAPAAARPEPALGWGAWNQPANEGISGPGGLRQIPGLAPALTASSFSPDGPAAAPGGNAPGGSLPGLPAGRAGGWHHGHFDGGFEAHQHGRAHHKAHPKSGGR